jgi:hypothetical protein
MVPARENETVRTMTHLRLPAAARRLFLLLLALCAAAGAAAQTGHQLFVGPRFTGTPPVAVPFAPTVIEANGTMLYVTVYLHRADDAGSAHPPALSFDLQWDPAVLALKPPPGAVVLAPLAGTWYDKQLSVNIGQAANGILSVSVFGGITFEPDTFDSLSTEITTFDNQLPVLAPEAGATQQNPFPLMTIAFVVKGQAGDSSALTFQGAVLSDQAGFALPNQGALATTVLIGGNFPPPPPGTPAMGLPAAALLGVALLTLALRRFERGTPP